MAFYITLRGTNYVAYTNGRAQGTTMKSKSGLEFKEGCGIALSFGSAFGTSPSSRIWNGVIRFCTPLITGINGVEINESESLDYPNPNAGSLNVNVSTSVGSNEAVANIYDISGRLVFNQNNITNNNFSVAHNLNSGMYMLQVVSEGTVVLNKKNICTIITLELIKNPTQNAGFFIYNFTIICSVCKRGGRTSPGRVLYSSLARLFTI